MDRFIQRHEGYVYCQRRDLHGLDGLVSFWEDYVALVDALFDRSLLDKSRLDVDSVSWDAQMERIVDFLSLPPCSDVADTSEGGVAAEVLGTYRFTHRGEDRECTISETEGAVVLDGLPDIWPRTRLLSLGAALRARVLPVRAAVHPGHCWPYRWRDRGGTGAYLGPIPAGAASNSLSGERR